MGILTQFAFQNAHGYPHSLLSSLLSQRPWVSSHSLPFKMPMGILTHFFHHFFHNAHGYPHTVCLSKCPWVSSLTSFITSFTTLMGILTQFAFQNAHGYPHSLLSSLLSQRSWVSS